MAQLVEHHLAKVGVAGSSPVSRSFNIKNEVIQMGDLIFCIKEHFTSRRDEMHIGGTHFSGRNLFATTQPCEAHTMLRLPA